jgi:alkaline phosphatase D
MLNPNGVYDRMLQRLSRRDLMRVAWALGAAAVARPIEAWQQAGVSMYFTAYPFSLGVASGDPLPDGIVLWTRLAPQPVTGGGMPMVPVNVQWELASDTAFRNVVQKGETVARPELGHSVHVEVSGLEPAHDYWYRFRSGNEISQVGRTRTAPAAGAAVDRLRFGICGCSHYETGFFTAYRRIAQEQFDFVLHTGDYIYEGRADGGRGENRVRQHSGDEIYTLVDYRNRYALYKTDPDLIAAHRSAPFIVSWDDHEVENNYAGDTDENGTPAPIFLLRRAAAYQAYYEHMPLRMTSWPSGPHMRIYRRLQFGSLIDLSMLDTRQWRSDQACNDGTKTCPASLDPARTMLGAEQEKWVFDNLATAKAQWTVLSQQVYSFARDLVKQNPDARFNMDVWDGYPAARQRLYSRIKETKAPNPIVISGDVHVHYGADLKLDFTDPKSEIVATEFTNTSVSASGDGADVAANWEAVRGVNPHIRYHSARRGYIACTATPQTMRADFRILDRVTVADAPMKTGGSLVVEAGKRGANLA